MTDEIQSSSADSLCNRFVYDNVKEKKLNNISNNCVINKLFRKNDYRNHSKNPCNNT